jgi:hypothetical protein
MGASPDLICVRCGQPVRVYKEDYNTFEKMHWLCFHLEFEHDPFDPDEPCNDLRCPQLREEAYAQVLRELGQEPDEIALTFAQDLWERRANST